MRFVLENKLLVIFLACFFVVCFYLNFATLQEQQYSYLAKSFLAGKTYFLEQPGSWEDAVPFAGRFYWHMGPFPAVILVLPVLLFEQFGLLFRQGFLQFFLTLGIFVMCFKLAKKYGFTSQDCAYLAFAFCFASVYQIIALVPWVWYFAQAVSVFFTFLAIHYRKKYLTVGLLMSFALATRFTAGLGIIFFILDLVSEQAKSSSLKFRGVIRLLIPFALTVVLLGIYNFNRFGNFFDNGFVRSNEVQLSAIQRFEQINYGLFQLRNVPTNIYYYFIKSLDPILINHASWHGNTYVLQAPFIKVGYPGTSFFVIAPIFIYALKASWKRKEVRLAWITIGLILFFLLTYYWPGWRQVGPRYTLDFLPFAYLLLLYSFKGSKLPGFAKILILASSIFDFYLFMTVFRS